MLDRIKEQNWFDEHCIILKTFSGDPKEYKYGCEKYNIGKKNYYLFLNDLGFLNNLEKRGMAIAFKVTKGYVSDFYLLEDKDFFEFSHYLSDISIENNL